MKGVAKLLISVINLLAKTASDILPSHKLTNCLSLFLSRFVVAQSLKDHRPHLTFQMRKVLVTRNLTLDVLRWWRGHETTLFSWLCCLRYLMASSMQIQRREGLGDMQWGHRGLCLMKNSELSLIPIITHEKIFQPFLDLLEVVKAWE